jgi:hypothetical protein
MRSSTRRSARRPRHARQVDSASPSNSSTASRSIFTTLGETHDDSVGGAAPRSLRFPSRVALSGVLFSPPESSCPLFRVPSAPRLNRREPLGSRRTPPSVLPRFCHGSAERRRNAHRASRGSSGRDRRDRAALRGSAPGAAACASDSRKRRGLVPQRIRWWFRPMSGRARAEAATSSSPSARGVPRASVIARGT